MITASIDVFRFLDGPPLLLVAADNGVPFSAEYADGRPIAFAPGGCLAYLSAVPADADKVKLRVTIGDVTRRMVP